MSGVRQAIHRLLHRLGVDVVRYEGRRFADARRAELLRTYAVGVFFDVGANDGQFAAELRAHGYRGRIVSFEPQGDAFGRLAARAAGDPLWECARIACGARDGTVALNVAGNSSSSSLFEMAPLHLDSAPESRYVTREEVPLSRLDTLRERFASPQEVVYLKADVQGGELDVLAGAEKLLASAPVVEVELSLAPLYDGAPAADEVARHLRQRGYALMTVEPVLVHPATGRLLQVNAIYGRVDDRGDA